MTAQELIQAMSTVPPTTRVVVKSGKYGYGIATGIEMGYFIRAAGDFQSYIEEEGAEGEERPDAVLIRG